VNFKANFSKALHLDWTSSFSFWRCSIFRRRSSFSPYNISFSESKLWMVFL